MAFVSDMMNIPVIDTAGNLPPSSEPRGYEQRDRVVDPEAGFAKPYTGPVFDRKEIIERLQEREAKKQRVYDVMQQKGVKPLHQGNTNYCWCNSVVDAVQVARALNNSEHIPLSPASVAAPIKNYRNEGGWGIQAVKYIAEHGVAPQSLWPANAINKQYDTAESRAAREPFKIEQAGWLDLPPDAWEPLWTLIVIGFPCPMAHMEYSHEVLAIDLGLSAKGTIRTLCRNSGYARDATGHSWVDEKFGRPDEALAIQLVTAG